MSIQTLLRAVVFSAIFAVAGHAAAHAHPKNETPANGAMVTAPTEVRVEFNEALEAAFSSLIVDDAQGHQITTAKSELDTATHRNLRVALPILPAGVYLVNWVAVGVDGHRTNGSYRFTIK